jgi:TPP-dependent trihydroxycyclohexane-1,2-dione (THcHDO) dehydratase
MREVRLTTAQALVRFLAAQHVKRDGIEHRSFGFMRGTWSPGPTSRLAR